MFYYGRADADMYFLCARVSQHFDYFAHSGTADDGIVDKHDALAVHVAAQGVHFYA